MIENLKTKLLAARKRAELEGALDRREVHDPFSSGFLISLAISAAVSAASYVVSMAFAPKPPKQTIGKLQGNLQLQNSEQGLMIPEIYGAGPTASLVAGASPTYQNLTNTTGGANGSITKTSGADNNYNAGASHNVAVTVGQDAFIQVIRGTGFAAAGFFTTASPTGSGEDTTGMIFGVAWHNAGPFYTEINGAGVAQGNTVSGDVFRVELRAGRFRLYKNSAEITSFGVSVPAPTFPLYFGVIMYTTGAGVSNCKIKIDAIGDPPNFARGGIKVPGILSYSSGIRKNVSVTETQVGGKGFMGGQSQTTEHISYDIDFRADFCKGPANLLRLYANADVLIDDMDTSLLLTGVYDPTTGPDADYDPELPPDPLTDYVLPINRWNNDIPYDGDGVGTGSVMGGAAGFAVYSGTETQDPDPTEEADVNAKFGTGSTTAHRGIAGVVLNNFDLSKWGGIVPNMTAAWEHQTLHTLDDIYGSLCDRVGLNAMPPYIMTPDNITGGTVTNNVFTKTAATGWNIAGGFSGIDSLGGDGYVEWAQAAANSIQVGLSTFNGYLVLDAGGQSATVHYSINAYGSGVGVLVREASSSTDFPAQVWTQSVSLFRITRTGSTITYSIDGTVFRTVTGASTAPLYPHGNVSTNGTTIQPVTVSTPGYDWSGLSTLQPRGMLIAGRLFSPAEVIGSPDIQTVYNYQATEAEGQLVGWIEGAEPTVTIADTEVGCMDSDAEVSDILPEVDTIIASEIGLAREVHVKYIDLDKEWEPNTQSDNRQITEGVSTEVVEVQLALLGAEARTAAQRKLYRDYVAGSVHKFTLPWTYLYLYPGYKVTITRAEGFNHVLKLTSISGGIGVLECEGVAIEPAAFTQPSVVGISPGFPPNQPIPAMTILTLLDTPLLRDGDETNNNGVGFYACGTARTGVDQAWTGFALYRNRNSVWGLVGSSSLPGTIGTIVSATAIGTDATVFDRVGVFVVDLYGTTASLSSVTEMDVLMDAEKNLALFGDLVSQFVTVSQVAWFPNRWSISVLLNGRRGTEHYVTATFTGKRFVLIDAAVKFVTAQVTDTNNSLEYRGVTSGQSLADAATVDFAWVGETLRPLSPINITGVRNTANDLLVQWERRSRIAQGLKDFQDVPVAEEMQRYKLEWYLSSTLKATYYTEFILAHTPFLLNRDNLDSVGAPVPETSRKITRIALDPVDCYVEATFECAAPAFLPDMHISIGDLVATESPDDDSVTWVGNTIFDINMDSSNGLGVLELGGSTYTQGVAYTAATARVRVAIIDGRAYFYLNPTGNDDVPLYVSQRGDLLVQNDLRAWFSTSDITGHKVRNRRRPHFLYTASQQTHDGFTPGNLLKVRISQISAIVGAGMYTEATI